MVTNGNKWLLLATLVTNGDIFSVQSVAVSDSQWECAAVCNSQWQFSGSQGSLWQSVAVYGNLW